MKKSIVIVDDHILIANAISKIVNQFSDFEVIYECENGKDLIDRINLNKSLPDIILLDISMPIMDGFETAKWLSANHPNILIMVLSTQGNEESVIEMIKLGVKSYLLKNTNSSELENALTKLIENGFFYPDWASKIVFENLNNKSISKTSNYNLSEREIEFLKYTTTEMSYKEIAEKMFCSPRTIEGYRDNLFEKLDLKSRVGLAVFAMKNEFS